MSRSQSLTFHTGKDNPLQWAIIWVKVAVRSVVHSPHNIDIVLGFEICAVTHYVWPGLTEALADQIFRCQCQGLNESCVGSQAMCSIEWLLPAAVMTSPKKHFTLLPLSTNNLHNTFLTSCHLWGTLFCRLLDGNPS